VTTLPELVLINGTVYRRTIRARFRDGDVYCWLRLSVPPNARPGKRVSAKGRLLALPEGAQVIDRETASRIIKESVDRWTELLRAEAAGKAGT
jgi:hypothetical protein